MENNDKFKRTGYISVDTYIFSVHIELYSLHM